VVLDVLSFGLIIPVFPKLVEQFTGSTAVAASTLGVFSSSWALMQFLFSPMAGVLSDRFGRRPVLLLSCTGLGFDFLMMALAPNLWWLWLGRIISGLTMASFSTSSAYIADVTPPEKRAGAYGMLGAAFGLGFILGPALGGILASIDLRLPFFIAAGGRAPERALRPLRPAGIVAARAPRGEVRMAARQSGRGAYSPAVQYTAHGLRRRAFLPDADA
jgi:DHA1 family tetracycline resistance protein-like MFS transporter